MQMYVSKRHYESWETQQICMNICWNNNVDLYFPMLTIRLQRTNTIMDIYSTAYKQKQFGNANTRLCVWAITNRLKFHFVIPYYQSFAVPLLSEVIHFFHHNIYFFYCIVLITTTCFMGLGIFSIIHKLYNFYPSSFPVSLHWSYCCYH